MAKLRCEMLLKIVLANLEFKANDPKDITGIVYFQTEDFCFPYDDWDDFVSPIVLWWKERFDEMEEAEADKCELLFMDGDYMVDVINKQDKVDLFFMSGTTTMHSMLDVPKEILANAINEAFDVVDPMVVWG